MKALLLLSAVGLVVGVVGAGCNDDDEIRVRRERVYVEQEPQVVIVREPPPTVVVERRPAPPSPRHVWVDGYWNWSGQRYVWVKGRWIEPPRPGSVWVSPRYDRVDRGYRYRPGYWRDDGRGRRDDRDRYEDRERYRDRRDGDRRDRD